MEMKSRYPQNSKVICFECLQKAVGRYVDSLTWFFDSCPGCGDALRICTKREHILEFKSQPEFKPAPEWPAIGSTIPF